MKVPSLRIQIPRDFKEVFTFLNVLFDQLMLVLRSLNPEDNYKGFIWEGSILPITTQRIPHRLNKVPRGRHILKHSGGMIDDGDLEDFPWTDSAVYLRNTSSTSTATVKVIFYV